MIEGDCLCIAKVETIDGSVVVLGLDARTEVSDGSDDSTVAPLGDRECNLI